MKIIKNKKLMLTLGLVMVGTLGVSGSFYAQNVKADETVYYYKAKNVLDQDMVIFSTQPTKEVALKEREEFEANEKELDGKAYTATFNTKDDSIDRTIESDYDGNLTCYEEDEETDCSAQVYQDQISDEIEMSQKEEFKEFTDVSAKVDGNGNMTCYKGDEEADCSDEEFQIDEESLVGGIVVNLDGPCSTEEVKE